MPSPDLRLCLWGPTDDSALGRLTQAACDALRRRPGVRLTNDRPELTLVLDPDWTATAPGARHVAYPWGLTVGESGGTAWAPSRWHQRHLPGAPKMPPGTWVHAARPGLPEDGGVVWLVIPAAAPVPEDVLAALGDGVYPLREAPGADDVPCLPADPAQRAAIWYQAAAVVLMPGCDTSLHLAIEARSAGVPVLVPKGDPTDELMIVNGIGAYGVQLSDPPYPDLASLSMRLSRMAGNGFVVREVDLSAWTWDHWAEATVTAALDLLGDDRAVEEPDGVPSVPRRFAIFSLTPATGNVAMEGMLARVLLHAGWEPVVIRCNGLRERCTADMVNPDFGSRTALCLNCTIAADRYQLQWAGRRLATVLFDEMVDPDALDAAYAALAAVPDGELMAYVYDGLPLGSWVESALRLEYFGEDWQALAELPAMTRSWLRSCLPVVLATAGYFARERPAGVTVLSGVMPWEKIVQTLAQRHGVRCVFYEGGQRPGSMILRDDVPACRYVFTTEWPQWADVPLSVAETARLDGFLRNRQTLGQGMIYVFSPAASGELDKVRVRLGLSAQRPVVVVFTSVVVDAISFEANVAFPTQAAWLDACLEFAKSRPDVDLVVRIHPAERNSVSFRGPKLIEAPDGATEVLRDRWPVLPDNVRVVPSGDSISTYDLIPLATVVLNYVSTVGLEAAAVGKPVITSAQSHYSDVGVVWQVRQAAEFAQLLTRLLAAPELPPHAVEICRRYMYFWFYRTTPIMPGLPHEVFDIVSPPRGPLPYWDQPGDPGGLDRYAAFLTETGPFVLPPPPERPHDAGRPLPVRRPGERLVLVWPDGWSSDTLLNEAILPIIAAPGGWRVVLMLPGADRDAVAPLAAVIAGRCGPRAPVTIVMQADAADQAIWWMLATAYVPPAGEVSAVERQADSFGVPRWQRASVGTPVPAT